MAKNPYTWDDIRLIRQYPHLLGHLAGKDLLTEMHSDWMLYLLDAPRERSLKAHRGSFKTTALSEIGIIWYLMFHPDARVVIVRKGYRAAADIVRNIGNIMVMPEIAKLLELAWGQPWTFTTRRDGRLDLSVKKSKTKETSVMAMGIDSGITGAHFDFGITDDVIDLNDRISESEREKTKFVLQEYRANIMDRGKFMVHIGTPWHKNDAWTILPPALEYPIARTSLITPEQEADIRTKTTPVLFAINYDLRFENEGDMLFRDPRIGTWQADKVTHVRAHVDAAFEGDHYCALTIMGNLPGGKLNAVGWVFPGNIKDWFGEIAKKVVQYSCYSLCMEDNADKGFSVDILRRDPLIASSHVWLDTYHELMNKHVKISTYGPEVWHDIEWAAETDPRYLEQIIDYREKMEPDDAPDSMGSLIREGGFSKTKGISSALWRW